MEEVLPQGSNGRRATTRARLLEAALDVFAERGYYGASIEHICERAGFTRGAFYSNFANKDALFFALFEAQGEKLLQGLRAALEGCRGSGDPVARFVSLIQRKDPDERRWYCISTEFTLYAIREPAAAPMLVEQDSKLRRATEEVIEELARESGRELIIDSALMVRMALAFQDGAAAQAYVEPERTEAQMLERLFLPAIFRTFTRPIGTEREVAEGVADLVEKLRERG